MVKVHAKSPIIAMITRKAENYVNRIPKLNTTSKDQIIKTYNTKTLHDPMNTKHQHNVRTLIPKDWGAITPTKKKLKNTQLMQIITSKLELIQNHKHSNKTITLYVLINTKHQQKVSYKKTPKSCKLLIISSKLKPIQNHVNNLNKIWKLTKQATFSKTITSTTKIFTCTTIFLLIITQNSRNSFNGKTFLQNPHPFLFLISKINQ